MKESGTIDLTRPMMLILLVLWARDTHGYAIKLKLKEAGLDISDATLYRTLAALEVARYIEKRPTPTEYSDTRRIYYGLTESGKLAMNQALAEIAALSFLFKAAGLAWPSKEES